MTRKRGNPPATLPSAPDFALADALDGKRQMPSREHLVYLYDRYWELKRNMDILCNRTDGWVRIVPKPDDNRLFLKFKYTRGSHERHYVMAVVETGQLPEGLMLLVHKLHQVDQGLLKPAQDNLYGGDE